MNQFKKIRNFVLVCFLLTALSSQAKTDPFSKFSRNSNIEIVQIYSEIISIFADSLDFDKNKLKQLDFYSADKKKAIRLMRRKMKSITKKHKYETLIKGEKAGLNATFYGKNDKNGLISLIIFADGLEKCNIIRLSGNFVIEDLQNTIELAMKVASTS